MILPDVNILIHAVNSNSPKNEAIRNWWDETLAGPTPVLIPWAVIIGFVRITTNPRIFEEPLSVKTASKYIRLWTKQLNVRLISPKHGHWDIVEKNLLEAGTGGNLTTDAHIAALALQWDCIIYTTDTDFARFPGIKWKPPN